MAPLIRLIILILSLIFIWILLYQWIMLLSTLKSHRNNNMPSLTLLPSDINCQLLFDGDKKHAQQAALWRFSEDLVLTSIEQSSDKCLTIQKIFQLSTQSLSKEEEEFPIAYAMMVHKDFTQILLLLSVVYQPQNQFSIGVDGKSEEQFYELIKLLEHCYPNIHVYRSSTIIWCEYEILNSLYSSLTYLTNLNKPWKYFQYLSGVDAPLKTNLEMVRILKALNGTFNAEIMEYPRYRLSKKRFQKPPIPLFKTSMSALFSRESAKVLVHNEKVKRLVSFLNGTICPDESLWVTAAGNPQEIQMPGGFDAKEFLKGKRRFYHPKPSPPINNGTFPIYDYYISRYQQWNTAPPSKCKGKFVKFSCVFGVYDLPVLIKRPEMVAHKLYMDYQPAAYFCLIQEMLRRTAHPLTNFTAEEYRHLPNGPKYL